MTGINLTPELAHAVARTETSGLSGGVVFVDRSVGLLVTRQVEWTSFCGWSGGPVGSQESSAMDSENRAEEFLQDLRQIRLMSSGLCQMVEETVARFGRAFKSVPEDSLPPLMPWLEGLLNPGEAIAARRASCVAIYLAGKDPVRAGLEAEAINATIAELNSASFAINQFLCVLANENDGESK